MSKPSILILILLTSVISSFGQNPEPPPKKLLKKYSKYIHKFEPKSCWKYHFELKKGLVVKQENYCKNKLTFRAEFEYDKFENVRSKTETYNINDGLVNNVSKTKLKYNDGILTCKEFSYGVVEKYSDFNEYGKPKLIERTDEHNIWPFKETFEYDENGNVIKSVIYSTYTNLDEAIVNEKVTTHFKYDKWNNVIEIHREFEPKREFPIIVIGGPANYEFEYFRYKYKENGLWTKKFKTAGAKEYLVAKRKYK